MQHRPERPFDKLNSMLPDVPKMPIAFCEYKGMLPELAWSCSDLAELIVANDGETAGVQKFDEQALDKTHTIKTGGPKGVRVLITETKSSS